MPTSSPSLTLPASESIAAGGTVAVSGIRYMDDFAAGNPGLMYLRISDATGVLSAVNSAGVPVAGSGTNTITLNVSYADVTAVLASLDYASGSTAGSDTISFDLWDQAGVETSGTIAVAIGSAGTTETWTGAVSSDWNTGGNWSGGVVPASGDTVNIPGGTPNQASLSNATLTGEAIALNLGGGSGPTLNFTNVTLGAGTTLTDTVPNIDPGPLLQLAGTLTIAAGAALSDPAGLFVLHTAPGAPPAVVVNHGTISANGGHLNIDTGGSAVNDGLIIASGSGGVGFDLTLHPGMAPPETILNSGTLEAANGVLNLDGTVNGGTVLFSGPGGLVLEQPNALTNGATIVGFGPNDSITLDQVTASGLSFDGGTLTVSNNGTVVESLPMAGSYTSANFSMVFQPSSQPSWVISYVATSPPPSGPAISAPASETVASGATVAVSGVSVADAFAASNPGTMALNVTDATGAISMTDSSGAVIAGSGSGGIHYNGTLNQVNAALASLLYTAPGSAGSDSITVDVWDQAGRESTQAIPVTISGAAVATAAPLTSTTIASGSDARMAFIATDTVNGLGGDVTMPMTIPGPELASVAAGAGITAADLPVASGGASVGPAPDATAFGIGMLGVTPQGSTGATLLALPQHGGVLAS